MKTAMVIKKCLYCGKEFEAVRSSAKYDSDTCRVKYNNFANMLRGKRYAALSAIRDLSNILRKYPEFVVEMDSILQDIKNEAHRVQMTIDPHKLIEAQNLQDDKN